MTHLFGDFESIIRAFAQRMIGDGKISLFGQPMNAEEFTALRISIDQLSSAPSR